MWRDTFNRNRNANVSCKIRTMKYVYEVRKNLPFTSFCWIAPSLPDAEILGQRLFLSHPASSEVGSDLGLPQWPKMNKHNRCQRSGLNILKKLNFPFVTFQLDEGDPFSPFFYRQNTRPFGRRITLKFEVRGPQSASN